MATRRAVLASLTLFALTFAGDVSPARIDLYVAALDDVTDEQLGAATVRLVKTHRGEWIPVPAVIREAAGTNAKPRIDVEDIRRQIIDIAGYNPHGFVAPRVESVRRVLGDAVADAYGAIGGGSRLFADDVTGAIALRDFAKELEAIERERGALALPAPMRGPKLLTGEAVA
jgi:bifunctional DNA-binding transcriptional regulator/antitoxin component of YhaV-PrlF toxin-antitoxin module